MKKNLPAVCAALFIAGIALASQQIEFTRASSISATTYVPSATPFTLSSVYVNNIPIAAVYGGAKLPAHPFTVQAIRFLVRTAGSGGSTSAVFSIDDGTNSCTCSYACNQALTGFGTRAACVNGTGAGCVFVASTALRYRFTSVGDCAATSADIDGNIDIEGIWQ